MRDKKNLFVGYVTYKCGYKCYDLFSKKLFISMDATFIESKSFFKSLLRGSIQINLLTHLNLKALLKKMYGPHLWINVRV